MQSFISPRQDGNWLENDENKMLISENGDAKPVLKVSSVLVYFNNSSAKEDTIAIM